MSEKESVKQEIYQAISYFIERQELVAQAMLDLGLDLDLIGRFGAMAWVSGIWGLSEEGKASFTDLEKIWGKEKHPEDELLLKAMKRNVENPFPQRGTWDRNPEWEYYLHGGGCLLTNKKTGEPINWDCPNLKSFDDYFFRHHLEWQLETFRSDRKDEFKHTQKWVERFGESSIGELIEEMREDGLLEDYQIMEELKYTLKGK